MVEICERSVAEIAVEIGSERQDGIASYDALRREVPRRYPLSSIDLRASLTRVHERVWEQKIRNIKSHSSSPGNYIFEGYLEHIPRVGFRVTDKGRALIRRQAAA